MADGTVSLALVGGLDAVLILAGMVLVTGRRKELRFVPCRCGRPECAGVRREWVAV